MNNSNLGCCALCGEPMHRYGYPRDIDWHEPSATACINGLRGKVEDLESELSRRHKDFERISTLAVQYSNKDNNPDVIKLCRAIRNIVG